MKLKDLLVNYKWDVIKNRFKELYPEESEKLSLYEEVFYELERLDYKKEKFDLKLYIKEKKDPQDNNYVVVGGFTSDGIEYSLAKTKWEITLGIEIDSETISQFSQIDIIAHCLWEMTFYGFKNSSN